MEICAFVRQHFPVSNIIGWFALKQRMYVQKHLTIYVKYGGGSVILWACFYFQSSGNDAKNKKRKR